MPGQLPPAKASDFDPEIHQLFDQYVHGGIDRRSFIAAAGAGGAALLAALSPDFARAQQVSPSDARIKIESLEFASPQGHGKGRAYVARPAAARRPRGS
jgi:carboxymethylenebutenolidase